MARRKVFALSAQATSQLVALVAAVIVAVLLNVIGARRFTRWDWTANKRYSLSEPTVQTLRGLGEGEAVQVWVLLGPADPLDQSIRQLLVAYQAETSKLEIHHVDPDRDVLALEDVKRRFKIETGRTEEGHVVADAIVVVARGAKHWFLTTSDMLQVAGSDDAKVSPREEQALTGAIRNVLAGERTRVCFTSGHGEMSPLDVGDQGTGFLKDLLEKDNYEVVAVDASAPNASEPFKGCAVAVVAGLRGTFTKDEIERLRTWLLGGGNLLLAASPITGDTATGIVPAGLERVLGPFGIALDEDLVLERDAELSFPQGGGMRFIAGAEPHPVTTGLVKSDGRREVPRVVLQLARSMHPVSESGSATATPLLTTSKESFGLTNVSGAAEWKEPPAMHPGDLAGPLTVAMASERPKLAPSAPHGPRVVVLGSASPLTRANFAEPLPARGAALLVESAISWLAAKPQVLDVPERAAVPAGIRITAESRSEIQRYVLVFMPGAALLCGLGVWFLRRASEGKPRRKDEGSAAAASKSKSKSKSS